MHRPVHPTHSPATPRRRHPGAWVIALLGAALVAGPAVGSDPAPNLRGASTGPTTA